MKIKKLSIGIIFALVLCMTQIIGVSVAKAETDTTPPEVSITMPANNSSITGAYDVKGTVSDTNMSNWVLEYGTGASPSTWSEINSGSSSITNGTLDTWYTSSLTDGTVYTLRLRATDTAGNTNQTTTQVTKDSTTAPTASLYTPSNNTYINGTVTVTGAATDTNMGRWTLDYGLGASPSTWTEINTGTTAITSGTISTWNTSSLTDGSVYKLRLRVWDAYGNVSQTTKNLTKDSSLPETSITLPANNAHITGAYDVKGTVSDAHLSNWVLEYGTGASPTTWSEITNGTTSITNGAFDTWYTSSLTDGIVYTLRLRATDAAGNTNQTTAQVTKDSTTAPTASLYTPSNNSYINGTVIITGAATDANMGSWTLDYGMGTSPTSWTEINTGTAAVTSGTISTWDTTSLTDGSIYKLRLRVWDTYGNVSQTTKNLTKDAILPEAVITLPANNAYITGTYTVTGSATDTNLSSWILEYGAGDSPSTWTTINSGTTAFTSGTLGTWNTSSLTNGSEYTLRLSATDTAGNTKQATKTVTIDTTAPVSDIMDPSNNSYVNGTITITGSANDENLSSWILEYGEGTSPLTWTEINTGTSSITEGTLGTLNAGSLADGTVYKLRLRVTDTAGNIGQTTKYITKDGIDPVSAITDPTNNAYKGGSITITGTASDQHLSNWTLSYGSGSSPETWTDINTGTASVTDGTLGTLDTSTISDGSYTIKISVTDAAQNTSSKSINVTIDNNAPTAPTDVVCTSQTNSTVNLGWTASTDSVGVTGYDIYRDGTKIGSSTETNYADNTITLGQAYIYTVKAKDAKGSISEASTAITVTTSESFSYSRNTDGTITITGYNGTNTIIEIPTTIDSKNVSAIAEDAFRNGSYTEVSFAGYIGNIGKNSFNGCGSLQTVSLPAGVGDIGVGAFSNCSNLNSFIVQGNTNSVGDYAFAYSSGQTVDFEGNINTINGFAFSSSSFTNITINGTVSTIDNYAFAGVNTTIGTLMIQGNVGNINTFAFYKSSVNSLTLNGTVSEIGSYAFTETTLGTLTLNEHVGNIRDSAFSNSTVASIAFPKGVDSIGGYAFLGCASLKTVQGSIGSIGGWAFQDCDSMESVNLTGNISSIGAGALKDLNSLSQITVQGSVGSIGEYAFVGDSALTTVNISGTITSIGNGAFASTAITSMPAAGKITTIGDSAFEYCGSLSDVELQKGLTTIGTEAFGYDAGIKSISIPYTVTAINNYAFRDCTGLVKVTIPTTVATIGESTFSGCTGLITPPAAPAELVSTYQTESRATIRWAEVTNGIGVINYDVYRDGSLIGSTIGTTYTDSSLTVGSAFSYEVKAKDRLGNVSASSTALSVTLTDTTIPAAPTNVVCSANTETTATLTWTAATDNIAVTGYEIYRDGEKVGDAVDTTFTDSNLTFGNTYVYTVKAKDAAGNLSNPASALSVTIKDSTAPTAPTNVTCASKTEKTVKLTWTASTDNVAVTGYDIYRDGVLIGNTSTLTYTDSNLSIKTYIYTVKAKDAAGNVSEASTDLSVPTVDITTPSDPTALACSSKTETSVTLTWTAATDNDGIAGYDVYRNGTQVGNTTELTYTDSGLTLGQAYIYIVKAKDVTGNVSATGASITVITDITAPTSPTNVAFVSQTDMTANISWTAATDNVGVAGYDVYRDGTKVGTTTGLTYADSNLAAGTYAYVIRAFDAAGNVSIASTPASGSITVQDHQGNSAVSVTITDTTFPTMGWCSPVNGTTYSDSKLLLCAGAVTDPSDIDSVWFSVYNTTDGASKFVTYTAAKTNAGTWEATFDAKKHTTKTGTFVVNIYGRDKKQNAGVMKTMQFVVNTSTSAATLQKIDVQSDGTNIVVNAYGLPSNYTGKIIVHAKSSVSGDTVSNTAKEFTLITQGNTAWKGTFNANSEFGITKGSLDIDLVLIDASGKQSYQGHLNIVI